MAQVNDAAIGDQAAGAWDDVRDRHERWPLSWSAALVCVLSLALWAGIFGIVAMIV